MFKGQDMSRSNIIWNCGDEPKEDNPYQVEWDDLLAAIKQDRSYNEVERGAKASLVTAMGRFACHTGQAVTFDLRQKLYAKVMGFKLRYFDRTPIGTLVTRVISDIETIDDIFSEGLLMIMGDILKLVVVVIVGVLAAIGVRLFREYIFSSKTVEAVSVIQAIRGAQERYRAETQQYFDVSRSQTAPEAVWYPNQNPDKTASHWKQPLHPHYANWLRLGVDYQQPVQFGYLVRGFANIYLLVLVFEGAFSELYVESAVVHTLPAIEQMLLALPPLDPEPGAKRGRVIPLHRR